MQYRIALKFAVFRVPVDSFENSYQGLERLNQAVLSFGAKSLLFQFKHFFRSFSPYFTKFIAMELKNSAILAADDVKVEKVEETREDLDAIIDELKKERALLTQRLIAMQQKKRMFLRLNNSAKSKGYTNKKLNEGLNCRYFFILQVFQFQRLLTTSKK